MIVDRIYWNVLQTWQHMAQPFGGGFISLRRPWNNKIKNSCSKSQRGACPVLFFEEIMDGLVRPRTYLEWGQHHGHMIVLKRGLYAQGSAFCNHHLEIVPNFIFEVQFRKWSPLGEWRMHQGLAVLAPARSIFYHLPPWDRFLSTTVLLTRGTIFLNVVYYRMIL